MLPLLASLVFVLAATQPAAAQDLFPDKNLEAVVRQYVFEKKNKPDPLVEADVVNISGIKADGAKVPKITNLAGLEKCKSLAAIELPNHEIADLAPLKDLKQLQSVILNKNKIASVAPLADLTGIQLLWIQDNQIADVAPLAKIAAMGSLDLSNNQIKDIAPLAELKKTHALYLDGNPIENFAPLASLKKLERLDLRNTGISDLTPLAEQTEWRFLFLHNNKITDLRPAGRRGQEGLRRAEAVRPVLAALCWREPAERCRKGPDRRDQEAQRRPRVSDLSVALSRDQTWSRRVS